MLLLGAAAGVGCTASAEEVRPPERELFFPTGAAISPDGKFLFVSNANSELRYDSGSVSVIDLDYVDRVADGWVGMQSQEAGCSIDPTHKETLACGEEPFIVEHANARIGNFATDIAVQDTGNGTARLIIPTRGDPSITWIDWNGTNLTCGGGQGFSQCDETHRLSYVHDDPDLDSAPDEPFDAFADSNGQFAVVTHLTTGAVTLIDSPIGGTAAIADVIGKETPIFAADPLTGLRGATGVAARPSAGGDIIYVASRSEDRVQMMTVGHPANEGGGGGARVYPYLVPSNYFFLNLVGANAGGSTDSRGLTFSPGGDRLYLLNRRPPSLQVYDTSLNDAGFPRNMGLGATDICRQASTLTVLDAGDGERAYVTCFQDGQVYVVDPRGLTSVEDIVLVGRGPYTTVGSAAHKKVYVTNFLEDTIAVIDVSPTSPRKNRVVLRIGDVRPL
ncbi:MAG TPA: YncE family protein [Kofleriaceae bacterium]|nr:YncE family protein [Kofleriaceae bacterium]